MPMEFRISVLVLLVEQQQHILSVLPKQSSPHWQEIDVLRNEIAQRLYVNEISNFLVETQSRWGPTQGLYPIWGPKITQGLHANEISNFHSTTNKLRNW